MVQLRPNKIPVVFVRVKDAVSLQLGVQVVRHLLRHVRVGVQLVAHHVRRGEAILKPRKPVTTLWHGLKRELQLNVVLGVFGGAAGGAGGGRRGALAALLPARVVAAARGRSQAFGTRRTRGRFFD